MKYKIFLFIFAISLISSIVLYSNSLTGICDPGKGCDVVNSSAYGSTFGVSNSLYGVFIFALMLILTMLHMAKPNRHTRNVIHGAVIIGALISIYFLFLQFFVIRVFCIFCLIIDFGLLIALLFMFYLWKH